MFNVERRQHSLGKAQAIASVYRDWALLETLAWQICKSFESEESKAGKAYDLRWPFPSMSAFGAKAG